MSTANDESASTAKLGAGWFVRHPYYGKWFISKEAVIADWKQDHLEYYGCDAEPSETDIESWFNEQISWVEIAKRGVQIERADWADIEANFMALMKQNPDYPEDTTPNYEIDGRTKGRRFIAEVDLNHDGAAANARLIAAAPDLLDALKASIKVTAHLDPCQATVEQARAAIAKAEGGAA